MRISGWLIDGFGLFAGTTVRDLAAGLTVFHGVNEAGKSTLLAFLRGVLFGFPDRRTAEPLYPPLRGGRHGGRVFLATDAGACTVERHAGKKSELRITLPDGREGTEEDLAGLLGGADARLFRSVFAFSLAELQSLATLNEEGVRERIFSAGIAGGGRPAHEVVRLLEERRSLLYRKRSGRGRLPELRVALAELESRTSAARQAALAYPQLVEEEERCRYEAERLRLRAEELAREKGRSDILCELWPVWREMSQAARDLGTLDAGRELPEDGAEQLTRTLQDLDRDLALQRERQQGVAAADIAISAAARSLDEEIVHLGPGWDEARLRAFDRSIPRREEVRAWEERLRGGEERVAEARRADLAAEERFKITQDEARAATQRTVDLRYAHPPDEIPDERALASQANAIRHLRANLAELRVAETKLEGQDATVRDLESRVRVLGAEASRPHPRWLEILLLCVAAAALALGAMSLLRKWGPFSTGGVSLLVAFLLAYLAYEARRRRVREGALARLRGEEMSVLRGQLVADTAARDQALKGMASLRKKLAEDAALLGLGAAPTFHEIEERAKELDQEREARASWERVAGELRQADKALAHSLEARGASARALEEALNAARAETQLWEQWKESVGIPPALSAQGVMDLFDAVARGQAALELRDREERRRRVLGEAAGQWEDRAREALRTAGEEVAPHLGGELLAERFARRRERWEEREALRRAVRDGARRISDRIGLGPEADAVREELHRGELETWRAASAAAARDLEDNERAREAAIKRYGDAERDRRALEESADVAGLETERQGIVAELASAVADWLALAMALALLEETLGRFERDRQPAVLAEASGLFAAVTDGRYPRIVLEEDGRNLALLDATGGRRRLEELSRGTAEQLYLALRLGLAAEFARRGVSLPLVMDDVLVNFDPARARATAAVLARFARHHQVLFFTCHPETRDLLLEADPSARHIAMEPPPP